MRNRLADLYEDGMEAFTQKDYVSAEKFFVEILSEKPNFADILNKMGVIYNQTDRLDLAIKAFEKALEINPRYTEASLNLAVTLGDIGRYDKAREVFEKAAHFQAKPAATADPDGKTKPTIDPFIKGKLADEHRRIGKIYYDMSLLPEAVDEFKKALELAPTFADIITHLATALRDQGKHNEAIKEYNRAIEINSHYVQARLHLGITYYSQGFYGLAEEEWRKALKIDPNNTAIKTYLNFVRPNNKS